MATKKSKRNGKTRRSKKPDVSATAGTEVVTPNVGPEPVPEAVVDEAPKSEPTATGQPAASRTGAAYHVLAGRPSKPAVIGVFTKAGYALSWVERAKRLGITPEELCRRFKDDPDQLKMDWAVLTAKKA